MPLSFDTAFDSTEMSLPVELMLRGNRKAGPRISTQIGMIK